MLVLLKLIRNSKKKYQIININNNLLNFKLLVDHNQVKSEKILIGFIQDNLAIDHNFSLTKIITRFLVFIIPKSYRSNITRVLK